MTQISRPFQIALAVLVLFVAVWFLALRGHSSSGSSAEPSTPVAAAPSAASSSPSPSATTSTPANSAPAHKAHHAAAPSAGSLKHTIDKAQGAVRHSQHAAHSVGAAKSSSKAATKPKSAATPKSATTHKAASAPSAASTSQAAKSHAKAPVTASVAANTQKSVEAQLKQGRVVAVLFWNPNGTVDGVVRHELQAVSRSSHGGLIVHIARADEIGAFGSFTRTVQV
ncbi:MAG TPA: hypothetical protein VK761_03085, partial [Solirubrobacteraceae bacterium]|nr:hypothetical protein [Solirubrobacteraceae bacterium]